MDDLVVFDSIDADFFEGRRLPCGFGRNVDLEANYELVAVDVRAINLPVLKLMVLEKPFRPLQHGGEPLGLCRVSSSLDAHDVLRIITRCGFLELPLPAEIDKPVSNLIDRHLLFLSVTFVARYGAARLDPFISWRPVSN